MWRRVREATAGQQSVASAIESLRLIAVEGSLATVIAPDADSFAAAKARRSAIESALTAAAGRSMRAEIRLVEGEGEVRRASAVVAQGAPDTDEAMNHPIVRRAMELFGARVIEVRGDEGE